MERKDEGGEGKGYVGEREKGDKEGRVVEGGKKRS